jgi:hypothetical protein
LLLLLLLLLVGRGFGGVKHRCLDHFVTDSIKGFLNFEKKFVETFFDDFSNRP